jgi:hypothetical protein
MPPEVRAVNKGLEWLAKQQAKDGHWSAIGEQYSTSMTALAGMAFLMEGSTIREGKYQQNLRRAADWLIAQSQRNGQIGNPNNPGEGGRYLFGHGYGMLFLSCVYGDEEDVDRRKKLEDVLVRAAKFSRDAQTSRGGWGYVSAKDGGDFDEGCSTTVQIQGLRAVRDAGIAVPPDTLKDALKYLKAATDDKGGVIYSLANAGGGGARPPITAAALAAAYSAREYKEPLAKQWLKFCQTNLAPLGRGQAGYDEFTHYYYAQSAYLLGDNGWAKLFPDDKEADRITWTKYRKAVFDQLVRMQKEDGSWQGSTVGPVYSTAVHLSILQLDNAVLPIYQR